MSEFEVRELINTTNAIISDQFQFWMAATFAVVVAAYTAGPRLAVWARACVAVLYVAAVATFYLRWRGATYLLIEHHGLLRSMGVDVGVQSGSLPRLVGSLRQFVILGGTVLAVMFILRPTVARQNEPDTEAR